MIDLSGLERRERKDRIRVFAIAAPASGLIVAAMVEVAFGGGPLRFPSQVGILLVFAIALGIALRGMIAAVVPRPEALDLSAEGIRLRFSSGKVANWTWSEWAARTSLRHISRPLPGHDTLLGDQIHVRTPIAHSFWIPPEASSGILEHARGAGLVGVSKDIAKKLISGRVVVGTETTFELS
jgi:hypothetical protein